jgi:imidazolonepropionase
MSITEIVNIGQLVTMSGPAAPRRGKQMSEIGIIQDAVVQIEGESITYVGPHVSAPTIKANVSIDAEGLLVTPGLVDAHTHAVFAGNRADEFEARALGATYQEIAARGGGILSTVAKTRAATKSELKEDSKHHLSWMRSCGTTTAEIKSGYGLNLAAEQKMLEVVGEFDSGLFSIVRTFLGAHSVPPEARSKDEYLDNLINEMMPALRHQCEFVDMFVEDKYFNHDDARRYAKAAQSFGLQVRLHVDQMRDSGGAILAAEIGAKTADHLEYTSEDGIHALANSQTMPVLLPGSVYGIRSDKYPNARFMIELGLSVVIATDFNPGSSPTPSLPFCMSLAMTKMGMSAAECLTACTINGAYSLNRGDRIGSVEPGKQADLVIWPYKDYREIAYWTGFQPDLIVMKYGQIR